MINITNLAVSLNEKSILKQINLKIRPGEFFGLIGPNGSGKTTLLKSIAKLISYQDGDIIIDEKNLTNYKNKMLAKKLSYVPQDTSIDFHFNVKDIVAMGCYAHGENKANEELIKKAMLATNTWQFRNKSILNLSGGQRQLVFIAKALTQDTPFILLDEPISALDIHYQMHILKLLKSLTRQGKTVIIVLHDLNLAARFCDQVTLLKNGQVEAMGSCEEVLNTEILKNAYQINALIRKDKQIEALQVTPL